MEPFRVHILGCSSALPTLRHNTSAQVVEVRGKLFMVDCGEGTQQQLRRSHLKFTQIAAVFISHTHGDHCFGLIGLLSTFGMLGRKAPLTVYAPTIFEPILRMQIDFFCPCLSFDVVFKGVDTTQQKVVYEDRSLTVETVPLRHRTPCCGYLFKEKPLLPHINKEMADYHGVPISQYNNIKSGQDWTNAAGEVIAHTLLTCPADPPRSYAYCSDTVYLPDLHKRIMNVNTLYHESTYGNDEAAMVATYMHSTAAQAAQVARDANAGKLLLGHYSGRYTDEEILLNEAKEIFPHSILTQEGMVIDV